MKRSLLYLGILFLAGLVYWKSFYNPVAAVQEEEIQSSFQSKSVAGSEYSIPLDHDQFSGKTVSTVVMADKMILHRESNAPLVGETAPEFTLRTASGDREVSLSELRQTKPVVLIMGSWGCDVFRETVPGLLWLYSEYKDQVHFVMVYIREAHSLEGAGDVLARVNDPGTSEERMSTAVLCREQLKLPFTILVDSIDDPVMTRWAAWPVRIYLVGTDGKVAYSGAQGPWGYRPYRGYQHGAGRHLKRDLQFNTESLAEFLETEYPPKSPNKDN